MMKVEETIKYVKGMKETALKDKDPRSTKYIEACDTILQLINDRIALQNRCKVFSGGALCVFCNMECECRETLNME